MSNKYKDWLYNHATDFVLEHNLADQILNTSTSRFVDGLKDGQHVRYEVWFDNDLCEWRAEHREIEK